MATVASVFETTIGRKFLMSLTGLFLMLFLVIHMAGNFQLVIVADNIETTEINEKQLVFNEYTKSMATSPLIKVASYVTYAAILLHIFISIGLTIKNRQARPVKYAFSKPSANSAFSSRNMMIFGSLILIFLIIHLSNFFYKYKFGEPDLDPSGLKDMYTIVVYSFKQGWYVLLYVLSMAGISFHLWHGFQSAFQSLGINHKAYTPVIKTIGYGFSIIIPLLFAIIPVWVYLFVELN